MIWIGALAGVVAFVSLVAGRMLWLRDKPTVLHRADDEAFDHLGKPDSDEYVVTRWVHVFEIMNLDTGEVALRTICDEHSQVWAVRGMLSTAEISLTQRVY